ncbi:MAG: hypothetical protein JWO89_984, partial [Verrucomicrobiaceae bacterium]|nr:hypothetical protein [Verrucomicrobiaceae bacterium]
ERLMHKRIDAWPPFLVKVRTHMTMRSLYEPPLVELDNVAGRDLHLAERELRHRAFLGLAAYLLTGERHAGGNDLQFGEAVSEPLARFLRSSYERTPAPSDFVDAFELHMGQVGPEGRGIAAIMAASAATGGDMEDAGAISDFDEDWTESSEAEAPAAPDYLLTGSATRKSFSYSTIPQYRKSVPGRVGMYVWAASVVLLLLVVRFVLFGGSDSAPTEPSNGPTTPSIAAHTSSESTVAARFSSAPDVGAHTSSPIKLVSLTPVSQPAGSRAQPDKVVCATPPSTLEVPEQTGATAAQTASMPLPGVINASSVGHSSAVQIPRESLQMPITIRKAIVPSSKELSDAKKEPSGTVLHLDEKPPVVEVVDHTVRDSR